MNASFLRKLKQNETLLIWPVANDGFVVSLASLQSHNVDADAFKQTR